MIYIYNDFGGTHTSVLAASYHLKRLDETREPTKEEILTSHNFNKLKYQDRGQLFFYGTDDEGNKVYTVARGRSKFLIPGMCNLIRVLQEGEELHTRIIFSNTSSTVNLFMTFGGFFSRFLRIHFIGVPLLIIGAKTNYPKIIQLMQKTKSAARNTSSQVVVLDNQEIK